MVPKAQSMIVLATGSECRHRRDRFRTFAVSCEHGKVSRVHH
jgi:hypothetical protein